MCLLLGCANGTFNAKMDSATGNTPGYPFVFDVNDDGKLDLLVANGNSNNVSILLGNGDGAFKPKIDFNTGPGSILVADVNYDGKRDIRVEDRGGKTISVLLNNGRAN